MTRRKHPSMCITIFFAFLCTKFKRARERGREQEKSERSKIPKHSRVHLVASASEKHIILRVHRNLQNVHEEYVCAQRARPRGVSMCAQKSRTRFRIRILCFSVFIFSASSSPSSSCVRRCLAPSSSSPVSLHMVETFFCRCCCCSLLMVVGRCVCHLI